MPLWRNPKRQQIIVFRAPLPEQGYPDFIKRCIGVPGDHIKIIDGQSVRKRRRAEGALRAARPGCGRSSRREFSAGQSRTTRWHGRARPQWAIEIAHAHREWRTGGAAGRIFHDGRQPRQFERQPLLGICPAREHHRHAADHLHVDRRARRSLGAGPHRRAIRHLSGGVHPPAAKFAGGGLFHIF